MNGHDITETERQRFNERKGALELQGYSVGYGGFPGGDPRNFLPDSECSEPSERHQWREDCAKWDQGENGGAFVNGTCVPLLGDDGQSYGHLMLAGYGLGTYLFFCPEDDDDTEEKLRDAA